MRPRAASEREAMRRCRRELRPFDEQLSSSSETLSSMPWSGVSTRGEECRLQHVLIPFAPGRSVVPKRTCLDP
jgi:hypothetical protein